MRTIMAGLAEFERDLIRDRVKHGLAAARARGVKLGRQIGQRPSDKKAKRVLGMHADGLSYRLIGAQRGFEQEHDDGHCQAEHRRAQSLTDHDLWPVALLGLYFLLKHLAAYDRHVQRDPRPNFIQFCYTSVGLDTRRLAHGWT